MTAEQWRRLDAALATALELPAGQRAASLRLALGDDSAALREAELLLAAESEADHFFSRTPARPNLLSPGARLGPWQLVRELGRGGMGVVWLAHRADGQAEMRAAVKFLDVPLLTTENRRRFAAEKRLLARLDHPHIARLLDPGLEHDGPPHFILEYVDGTPLLAFASSLPLPARVRLLIQIAGAVQHAHSNLVIHRDLNPANILVTAAGDSKLLDFGIARLSESSSANTRTLFRAMSLDYASPEQIRGEEVSTATDIYSLGLVFYEVLTGRPARRWSDKPVAEAIRESERFSLPPAPGLDSDLRAILDKAAESDPSRRYASAADLAADLDRFLQRRPVEARPRTALYTVRRFVDRNRWSVALSLVAATAIVTLAVVAIVAGLRAEASRQIADARLRQVEAANVETRRALATAESQRALAESQSRLAAARRRDMEDMSFSLLNETYRELGEIPAATGVRARLIEKTLARLERLRQSAGENQDIILLIADAHGRLAEELGGSNENLGRADEAHRHLTRQFQILDDLRRRSPGSIDVTRLWAESRVALWISERRRSRTSDTRAYFDLLPVWENLLARAPRNIAVLRGAGSYYFNAASSLSLPPPRQLESFEKALAIWGREESVSGGGENVWRNLALAHKYIAGTISRSAPSPRQLQHAEKALFYDRKRLDRNSANVQARMDLTFDITAIADYHARVSGNLPEATRQYREALRLRLLLLDVEPANSWYRRSILYPAHYAAWMSSRQNDIPALTADLAAFRAAIERSAAATSNHRAAAEMYAGDIARHHNRPEEACAAWTRAARLDPGSPGIKSRLASCAPPAP